MYAEFEVGWMRFQWWIVSLPISYSWVVGPFKNAEERDMQMRAIAAANMIWLKGKSKAFVAWRERAHCGQKKVLAPKEALTAALSIVLDL